MWPGVRRAGLPRQSPALTPGQRRAQRAALIKYGSTRQRCVLALTTELRRGELLALWWDDIDLGSRQLHVLRALQRVGGKLKMGQAQDWQLRADGRAA